MRFVGVVIVSFVLFASTAFGAGQKAPLGTASNTPPNILLIVADDLGYSDIGSFGGEINTPVLDRLAQEGLRFSNFHVLPTCSPTRAALMSGNHNHVAGMGVMSEFIYPEIADLPGYAGHLVDRVATVPELLRAAGYTWVYSYAMYTRITRSGSRHYLQLVEGYRDTSGRVKQRVVASLGRVDKLDAHDLNLLIQGLQRAVEHTGTDFAFEKIAKDHPRF